MTEWEKRKQERRQKYLELHGKKLKSCTACNGSGYYDSHASPKCGLCNGSGKIS